MANSVVNLVFTDEQPSAGASELVAHVTGNVPTGPVDIADGSVTAAKLASGVLPSSATADKAGLVKLAAVTPQVKKTSADAAGDAPTKAEYDALRAEVEELKTAVNSIINNTRAAGQAASK